MIHFTPEQLAIQAMVRAFPRDKIAPRAREWQPGSLAVALPTQTLSSAALLAQRATDPQRSAGGVLPALRASAVAAHTTRTRCAGSIGLGTCA